MPQLIDHTPDHTHSYYNNELHFKKQYSPACMCAGINYFDHVVFMSDALAGQGCPHSGTNNTTYAYLGTNNTNLRRSLGTRDHAPEIRYRPGNSGTVEFLRAKKEGLGMRLVAIL